MGMSLAVGLSITDHSVAVLELSANAFLWDEGGSDFLTWDNNAGDNLLWG